MAYDTEVLADSPVVYWRLDDATTATAVDSSGNGWDGTEQASGLTALQTALINDGNSFEFAGDFLRSATDVALQTAINGDWTGEWWIQFDSGTPPAGDIFLYSPGDGSSFRAAFLAQALNALTVFDGNGNDVTLTFTALVDDTPHHLVLTYDDSAALAELWIDGVSVDSGTVSGGGLDPVAGAAFVDFGDQGGNVFLGDEFALYDTILSSARIGVHYTEGAGGGGTPTYEEEVMADTPELYWRLDETTTASAIDTSGNAHTGSPVSSGGGTLSALIEGLITQGTAWEISDAGATPIAYIESGTSAALAPATDFSFEFWVQFDTQPGNTIGLVSVQSTIGRFVSVFDTLATFVVQDAAGGNSVSLTTAAPLTLGEPHHIVVTYDAAPTPTVELWVDNVLEDSGGPTPSAFAAIGTPGSTRFRTQGVVSGPGGVLVYDEIAFYLAILSPARIEVHYDAGFLFYHDAALLGVARASTTGGVFLSQDGEQIADIQAFLLDIDDMDNPVLPLDQAVNYTWQDPYSEPGAGNIELQNDDPDLASIAAQSLVQFQYKGWAAFTMICEEYQRTSVSQNEEHDQTTVWSGRGHLALLERGLVYPTGGVGRLPVADDRGFNWSSPEYDDGAWVSATSLMTTLAAKTTWGGGGPLVIDANWPDDTGRMIWASSGTVLVAPEGTCYFRRTYTIAVTGRYLVYWLSDNEGSIYIDGLHLQDSARFTTLSTALIDLTAGDHTFAVRVTNFSPPVSGPGAFAFALYTAGAGGEPITLIANSNTNWLILEYPPVAPGMTPGEVMRICVDEMQARGVLTGLTLTFTDASDTAGEPWPEVADIATKCGTDVLTFFRELAGTYVDIWMEPGALRLSAWNYGTRGTVRPVVIESPTDPNDPDSGNLTALIHRGTG